MAASFRPLWVFRIATYLFASVLAIFSLWLLLPEIARPAAHQLPTDPAGAATAASAREGAYRAARVASVRGDLWAESAFTYAALLWPRSEGATATLANEARFVLEKATAYAPYDPSVWLLAAGLGARFKWQDFDPVVALKMSYYTGPNEIDLIPLRLLAATQSNSIADDDVTRFLERDVRMILTRWPALKPAVVAAYKGADPRAKRLLEATVAEGDATFLATMRGGRSP